MLGSAGSQLGGSACGAGLGGWLFRFGALLGGRVTFGTVVERRELVRTKAHLDALKLKHPRTQCTPRNRGI